ncbi:MAG: hypothetical protein COA71_09660 [SAR86 cluster bacterium]|uniref:histidine kinase n=1 Tax=SAR86 cluster bacterium TaxID=2030880 RepID=A0A2A5CBP6_9GAMM|nr:response regulator [Gammaproteobacteria bacterium AH-315-E17]PCJ40860.1 MAG: hypothetical protein COA71_09660 [SAR86 cluster bacterium]
MFLNKIENIKKNTLVKKDWNLQRSTRLEKEAQQLAITEATSDLVATVDTEGFLMSLNTAGYALLGLKDSTDITLYRLASFYTDKSLTRLSENDFPNAIKHNVWLSETTILSSKGIEIPASQVLIAHKNEYECVISFSIILRDISPLKEAEKKRQELANELHQAKKMETIGRLAGGIAHDFNNILSVIMGYSELGLLNNNANSENTEIFEKIINSSQKAARLNHQLLDFSSKQMIEPQTLSLNEVVNDSKDLIYGLMKEEINIDIQLQSDLWPINIDRSQLEQIILNLAVNARDALSKGQDFTLTTQNIVCSNSEIEGIILGETTDFVLLTVSDSGSGISSEDIGHIFEQFYTTKKPGHGTGLGLSSVYAAIKQNNAHIVVKSPNRKGTTFNIYFPRISDSQPIQGYCKPEIDIESHQGKGTILLVEDNHDVRTLLSGMLSRLSYSVLEAKSSKHALNLYESNSQKIDLVITDIVMPEFDGLDLYRLFQEINPELKILLISGHTERIQELNEISEDNIKLLTKPFSMSKLVENVKNFI